MDGEQADMYPPMADNHSLVKDWVESLLQNCSKERMLVMLVISKQYLIPDTTSLTKDPLYHAVFNHMQTIQDCTQCGGDCETFHTFTPTFCHIFQQQLPQQQTTRGATTTTGASTTTGTTTYKKCYGNGVTK